MDQNLTARARGLRRLQTPEEALLWSQLRAKRLLGFKFRRQHPIEYYVVDFVCLAAKLIIELDGGHHFDEIGRPYDAARTARLEELGYRILRFPNRLVREDVRAVARSIGRALVEFR